MPAGDATREKAHAAEEGIAGVRVAVIALNSLVYLFLMDKAGTFPILAHAIIVVAFVYSLAVYFLKPYRRFDVLPSSYFTSASDAALITLWLLATGGIHSPFHLLWLLSLAAVAFRYQPREVLSAALLYAACDLGLLMGLGQIEGHAAEVTVRVGYIFLVGAVGSLIARETYSQTRQKHEMRDLAEALRESEERFRLLSDAAFEGIAIHAGGRLLEVNRAFARLYGRSEAELAGASVLDLVAPGSRPLIERRLRHPSDEPYEVVAQRPDGSTFVVELAARDLPYRGRTVRVVAARDVTERRRAEEAQRARAALEAANEQLTEMDRFRAQFINNAAHELGTPLTPIKLQAHMLRTEGLGPLNQKQRRAVEVLWRNLDHLGRLVQDLLDASRLQAGKLSLHPKPADLRRLVLEAAETFQDPAARAGVELRVECPEPLDVVADPHRLTQVLLNLLSNAVKFTPEGGRIEVRAASGPDGVEVTVKDSGRGLREDETARLFQAFSQVHDPSERGRSGTGLGLYITKGILEQHGGRVFVRSEGLGKGSTFGFVLPKTAEAPAAAP